MKITEDTYILALRFSLRKPSRKPQQGVLDHVRGIAVQGYAGMAMKSCGICC